MFEKILVVDYDVETRTQFYEIFSSLAYKVTCVPTGKEAIMRLVEDRPDLIIIDENIPDMSARETVAKIRDFDRDVKIVILSEKEVVAGKGMDTPLRIKKDFSTHFMMKRILELLQEKGLSQLKEVALPEESKGPVLVVDDNAEVREVLWSFLSRRGYKVAVASSGEEALMKIKTEKERPRVVILDVRMPGMDGVMTLKRIKELDNSIEIVMLTSTHDEYIVQEAREVGASDYLVKPCDFYKLDALLLSVLVSRKNI